MTTNILSSDDIDKMSPDELKKAAKNYQAIQGKYFKENNTCQRQGRCILGCIPGARDTLNKQIYSAINRADRPTPLDVHPLCEVIDIWETGEQDIDTM